MFNTLRKTVLVLVMCLPLTIAPTAHAVERQEIFSYQNFNAGPGIWLKDLGVPVSKTLTVEVTFDFGSYQFTNNNHIAIGIGDLYSVFEGKAAGPVGEGAIIGYWNGCANKQIVIAGESFSSPTGKIIDEATCYGPLVKGTVYTAKVTVTPDHNGVIELWLENTMLSKIPRSWSGGHTKLFRRGFFFIPIANSPTQAVNIHSIKIFSNKD